MATSSDSSIRMLSLVPDPSQLARFVDQGAHASEVVLVSAHLDHRGPGYPGADDNGSGSAALVAIAKRVASASLDRTVALLRTAGEELGLVGSSYFTSHPPASVPLDALRGCRSSRTSPPRRPDRWREVAVKGAPSRTPSRSPGRSAGVVVLQTDQDVPVIIVTSVFQTAAFAGYPNVSFMVGNLPNTSKGT